MDFAPRIGFFIMDSNGGLWAAVFIRAECRVLRQSRHTLRNRECRFSGETAAQMLSGHGEWCIPGAVLMRD
jgi:hypothetical protein